MVEFGVLGPVTVCRDGCAVALSGGRLRQLLAVLLCRANQPVRVDALIDALWTGQAPATACKSLQVYVHRLRRRLDDGRVRYGTAGYSIVVDSGELDAWRFADLAAQARAARRAGRLDEAGQLLAQALAQWRAAAYADVPAVPIIAEETRRLAELRLVTLEERIAVDLDLGHHCELVPELSGLARAHPYREALQAQLMLALYRSGRRAEALEIFRNTRALLVDELGIEPTAALQRLHQQILTADPAINTPTTTDTATATDAAHPVADLKRHGFDAASF